MKNICLFSLLLASSPSFMQNELETIYFDSNEECEIVQQCCNNHENYNISFLFDEKISNTNQLNVTCYLPFETQEDFQFETVFSENVNNSIIKPLSKNTVLLTITLNDMESHSITLSSTSDSGISLSNSIYIFSHCGNHYISTISSHDAKFSCYTQLSETETPSYVEYYSFFKKGLSSSDVSEKKLDSNYETNGINSSINANGIINWEDSVGQIHPLKNALIKVYEVDIFGIEREICSKYTDQNGCYSFLIDEDEFLEAGTNDLRIFVCSKGGGVDVVNNAGATYEIEIAYLENSSQNDFPLNYNISSSTINQTEEDIVTSFNVHQAASFAALYSKELNGELLNEIQIEFPTNESTSCYDSSKINIHTNDKNDWDVIIHEYGHYVLNYYGLSDSPGGPHGVGNCLASIHGKEDGIKLAWAEGLANYFSVSAQLDMNLSSLNIPFVGDYYFTTHDNDGDINVNVNLELPLSIHFQFGESNEFAIAAYLLDLADGINAEENDNLSMGYQVVWDYININKCQTLDSLNDVLSNCISNYSLLCNGFLLSNLDISPKTLTPSNNKVLGTNAPSFSWIPNGGDGSYVNNNFSIVFYDKSYNLIFETEKTTATTYTLKQSDWYYIWSTNSNNYLFWAIKSWQTSQLETGYYLSDFRKAYVPTSHAHNFAYETYDSQLHKKACECGFETKESHTFQTYKNGNRCTLCNFFTTGPVIIGPIITSINETPDNEKESFLGIL